MVYFLSVADQIILYEAFSSPVWRYTLRLNFGALRNLPCAYLLYLHHAQVARDGFPLQSMSWPHGLQQVRGVRGVQHGARSVGQQQNKKNIAN